MRDWTECIKVIGKMNESVKVRSKVAVLLGFLAEYNSLGCCEFFIKVFKSKINSLS